MNEITIVINESELHFDDHIDDPEVAICLQLVKALDEIGIKEPSNWAFCNPEQFYKKLGTIFYKMLREEFPQDRKVVFWFYKKDANAN